MNVAYTPYDRRADVATFLVRPNGQVIDGPTENVDEDDRVEVVVWAPEAVASTLRIRRISPIRNPTFRILGAGTDLSPLVTKLADLEARCIPVRAVLSDFEPPRGEVQISTLAGGAEVVLGSFEFVVDPLYNGILSFGAVRTKLINQGFALAPKGEEKIIVPTEEGQWATRYAVFFTPYVWEARDPVKGPRKWFHRFNPLVGITTDHIGDNAIFGASVDLGPIQAIGGWHLSHVADLSPDSGLTVGGPFTGEASAIPTVKSWKSSTFFGISLDVRAAAALLKTVLGSGGGS